MPPKKDPVDVPKGRVLLVPPFLRENLFNGYIPNALHILQERKGALWDRPQHEKFTVKAPFFLDPGTEYCLYIYFHCDHQSSLSK